MDVAVARRRLERMVDASEAPALDATDIDDLLAKSRIKDVDGNEPDTYSDWAASTAYAVGDLVAPTSRNGHYYRVSTAGTSGNTEPTWPTDSGDTVVDGGVTWTEAGSAGWEPTYNLNIGAAEGWRIKAGRVATRYDFSQAEGQSHSRSQQHAMMLAMAEHYANKIHGTLETTGGDTPWERVIA